MSETRVYQITCKFLLLRVVSFQLGWGNRDSSHISTFAVLSNVCRPTIPPSVRTSIRLNQFLREVIYYLPMTFLISTYPMGIKFY